MRVEIVSMTAAVHGGERFTWSGDVPGAPIRSVEHVNEYLFRFFNRVDEEDGEQLAKLGYFLPSLSAGDFVGWNRKVFRVEPTGFAPVNGDVKWLL